MVFTGSFGNDSLLYGNTDLKTRTGDNLAVSIFQYKYSFELTPVGGNESSGEQEGNPNLNGMFNLQSILSNMLALLWHSTFNTLFALHC